MSLEDRIYNSHLNLWVALALGIFWMFVIVGGWMMIR